MVHDDQRVGELVHVAGGLEHDLRADGVRVDLDEALAQGVGFPPDLDDVVLHGGAQRPVVVQAGDAAVDLIGRPDETSPLAEGEHVRRVHSLSPDNADMTSRS